MNVIDQFEALNTLNGNAHVQGRRVVLQENIGLDLVVLMGNLKQKKPRSCRGNSQWDNALLDLDG
jgi:hypothetical protein